MPVTPKLQRLNRASAQAGIAEGDDQTINVARLLEIDDRVGAEIRDLRRARGLTLAEVSETTGLSQGYLSQIERGKSSPSVKALHSISRALSVTISWFFSPNADELGPLRDVVVRAGQRRSLRFNSGIVDELLSPNLRRKIELLRCVFPPGSASGEEPYAHIGEEAGIVVSGKLRLWIGSSEVILEAGDSFAFESERPHRYDNPYDEETVVIWAITPPSY